MSPAAATPPATAPSVAASPTPLRLYWIDWLRFCAAALVLLDHASQGNWAGPTLAVPPAHETLWRVLLAPIHLGREAVVVFFVLSGALVGGNTLEKIRAGTFDLRAYAADRIARVYVPLIPALLLSIAVARVAELPVEPWAYAGCLFGLHGVTTETPFANGPLWSLAYEMWFYLLAGCAAVVADRRGHFSGQWFAALGLGALALGVLCFRLEWANFACWLMGAGGFALRHRIARAARPWLAVAGVLLMLAGVAGFRQDLLAKIPSLADIASRPWVGTLAPLVLAGGTLLLVVGVCLSAPRTRVVAWVERAGAGPAAFSYTLYLTHYPVVLALMCMDGVLPEVATSYSLFRLGRWLAWCLGVAVVMYALFERRTPQARLWLRARLGGGTARTPTAPDGLPLAVEA